MRALVLHRAALVAPALRASLRSSLARRYWGILFIATQRGCADCLLEDPLPLEFTSLPLPSPDTLLARVDAPFGVDALDVSLLPPTLEHKLVPGGWVEEDRRTRGSFDFAQFLDKEMEHFLILSLVLHGLCCLQVVSFWYYFCVLLFGIFSSSMYDIIFGLIFGIFVPLAF